MNCPNCGSERISEEARACPNCGTALSEAPRASVQMAVTQEVGSIAGSGKAAGVEIGQARDVTVVLQSYGTRPGARRVHVPPGAQHTLFGRETELARTTAALRERRTVLLHGLGGIGKTALAAEAARRLHAAGAFAGGVLWVGEVGAAPLAAICDAVARGLGDEEILKLPPAARPDATRELLAAHDLLLILDDLAAAATADAFVGRCLPPERALLASSRERHLAFAVDLPLRPPDRDAAMALFRERANLPEADGTVGAICDLLERHPLALVIAAGRVRAEALPLPSLHARLTDEKTRLPALRLGESDDKNRNVWASLARRPDGWTRRREKSKVYHELSHAGPSAPRCTRSVARMVMTTMRTLKIAPGPRGHFLFGSLPAFRRDPLGLYLSARRAFGDVIRFHGGPWTWYLLAHPDDVRHVLQDNHSNYRKGRFYDLLRPVLGEGLLTSEGTFWLRQRRLAQPAFHRRRLADFGTTMTGATTAMLERWRAHAAGGEPINVAAEMMRLTLEIVGRTLFSTDVTGEAEAVGQALTVVIEHINDLETRLFPLPASIPTPANRRYRAAQRALNEVVRQVIEERRRAGVDHGDLLAMLMDARDAETGATMSDPHLRDEVMTIFLAGHETTANALSWTWYLLSKHPEVERRLRAELVEVLGGRPPTVADLPDLTYAQMVIEEALRLYPPVWGFARQAISDDEVSGYYLPANALVVLSPYVTHRHPDVWENPEGFDPERFTPERAAGRPRFAYFPFSGGPRQCIGNAFATMEAQLILATVAQHYRLDLVPGHPVEPEPTVTLRPRHGVLVTLHEQATRASRG